MCVYVCLYVRMCVYVGMCVYVCMYVCMYSPLGKRAVRTDIGFATPLFCKCSSILGGTISKPLCVRTYVLSSSSSQLCPSHTSHHLCLMVQSILLASSESPATPMPTPPPPDREGSTPPCSQGTTLPSSQGSSLSFLSSLKGQALPPRLRAHAYITLGTYIRTYVCEHVCACTYVCMYVCTYVHTYVHLCIRML